ncbi:hypothetical protein [Hymenobacter psychrophilus]|uniref:Uncharacterized protein n=1 Tax=Hymenobacter psychrophilus TaxID=651662 RepID=A0A1H3DEP3_9BACT|nr:hypothetical protein [Hymenobacter psychrophilus]SDX64841.1 hypothetical protein SAMN04488069_102330 [Hymenobacter psychrophilus]
MKLMLAALLALLLAQPARAQSLTRLDGANGFRGLAFGAPLTEALHLQLLRDKGDEKVYERLDEQLQVGGFRAARIHYKFFRGQFAAVTIIVKGNTETRKVRPALEALYGPGQLESFSCKWQGALVALSYASLSDEQTILAMSSRPLAAQMQQASAPANTTKLKIKRK